MHEHDLQTALIPHRDRLLLCVASPYLPVKFRDIQKMMLYRGIGVTYEAIRLWCLKFAQSYANQIRCKRPKPADEWNLDEVGIKIKRKQY